MTDGGIVQGFAGELDLDEALDHRRAPGRPAQHGGKAPQSSKKRQYKDAKFGAVSVFSYSYQISFISYSSFSHSYHDHESPNSYKSFWLFLG